MKLEIKIKTNFKASVKSLPRSFYRNSTVQVARDLLGCVLIHDSAEGRTAGRIVETEAYLRDDPACHAFRGPTPRTEVMFGAPGHAYIYFIYGMYYCFNVVTAPKGVGEAVLIRALEPVAGLELMQERRGKKLGTIPLPPSKLCNGPGKLVIAMGITARLNRSDLKERPLYILPPEAFRPASKDSQKIICGSRIGIRKGMDLPLRFALAGHPCVSR